jgi:hypothetical protein
MLRLRVGDWVESAHAHHSADRLATAVVGVRVCTQHAAKIRFEPQVFRGLALLATLVHAVGLDGAGDGDVDAHV